MSRDANSNTVLVNGVELAASHAPCDDGGQVTLYSLRLDGAVADRPAVLLLHGSGANSVFPRHEGRLSVPLLFHALCDVSAEWDLFFVEKRGIGFGDAEPQNGAQGASAEYREHASYAGRVAAACAAIDHIVDRRSPGCTAPFVVIGSSEGSNVAAGVAAKHCAPTHIALLPFSGGHGLLDCLIELRGQFARGEITSADFREQYDWLVDTFRQIGGGDRESTDKYLWGHTYRRWSSYCSGQPLEDLLSLEIPVFLGIPSLDRCEGCDLVVAEFVRRAKTNLTYRNYANHDHGFFERTPDGVECRHAAVLADILAWSRLSPARLTSPPEAVSSDAHGGLVWHSRCCRRHGHGRC